MNVFSYLDYRKFIKDYISTYKQDNKKITYTSLANFLGVHKVYISKVINGEGNLSGDQSFLAKEFFKFKDDESEYFQLLVEKGKASEKKYAKHLQEKIDVIRAKKLHSINPELKKSFDQKIDSQLEYYLDPVNAIVHFALFIKKYRDNPLLIQKDYGIGKDRYENAISILLRNNVIEKVNDKFEIKEKFVHLDNDSPIVNAYQTLVKLMSSTHLLDPTRKESTLSWIMAIDADLKEKLKTKIFQAVNETYEEIKDVEATQVIQFNFELFDWIK